MAGYILIHASFDAFVEFTGPKPFGGITFLLLYSFVNTHIIAFLTVKAPFKTPFPELQLLLVANSGRLCLPGKNLKNVFADVFKKVCD